MPIEFNPAATLEAALRHAAMAIGLEDVAAFVPEVRPADPRHGDFQANGVLGFAKARKLNPRAMAERLVGGLDASLKASCEVTIAGPGFINFRLSPATLVDWLNAFATEKALEDGAGAGPLAGQTWVLDYSSPNTAKQMHVGHLRSAVIGEAIARLLAFGGARVIRDNHIGDWGTQFGKLIWAYQRQLDAAALAADPLEEFERLYKIGSKAAEADPAALVEAQQELAKLQAGDAVNLAIWKRINEVSLAAFQTIYDQLGIKFDFTLGESFYNDKVAPVYRELRFKTQPFIIRKSDGAANYASTDLATVLYRQETWQPTAVLYVVDSRQRDHFDQLFATVRKWFAATGRHQPELKLIDFGMVQGEGGTPLKTRSGDNIKLKDLLAEATERARALVDAKSAELPELERQEIAAVVGIGSVQYADLAQNRSSDYVFAWDKMISLEGNTAAYLLYAIARIRSIFRKVGVEPGSDESGATALETAAELALARKLVTFPDAIQLATAQQRPHFLCLYLYELAGAFSAFYSADKVAVEDPAVRARRLMLCARTLLFLETGMGLLGLRTLRRM
jgi:arginyl-tRNA synthetase